MKIKKVISAMLISTMLLTGCSLENLKGNGKTEVVDNDKKYENWNSSGIDFDGKLLSTEVKTSTGTATIEYGSLKRKGYMYFRIKGNSSVEIYKKQNELFTKGDSWIKTKPTQDELSIIEDFMSFYINIEQHIDVLNSEYVKTVTDGDETYDVLKITIQDKEKQKELDLQNNEDLKIKDNGDYGNGISVIINDDSDEKEDLVTMDIKVYVNPETEEIRKLQWYINGTKTMLKVDELELIDKKASEVSFDTFVKTIVLIKEGI